MKTLISVKKDMEFNNNLSILIETLKSIAIQQYYAMEKKLSSFEKFFVAINHIIETIDFDTVDHVFANSKKGKPQAIIAITSDAGFLGGLNMKVINIALGEAQKMSTVMIVVGERGKTYVRGATASVTSFPGIQDEAIYAQATQLRDYICQKVINGEFGTVKIVHPRTISFGVQHIDVVQLLPFRVSKEKKGSLEKIDEIILESRNEEVVEYLAYLWIGEKLNDIFGLSRLAEFSARYVHLEESTEKLKDISRKTKLEYFRVRHELADRAIRELVAGRSVRGRT